MPTDSVKPLPAKPECPHLELWRVNNGITSLWKCRACGW